MAKSTVSTENLPEFSGKTIAIFSTMVIGIVVGLSANFIVGISDNLAAFILLITFGVSYGIVHSQFYEEHPLAWIKTSGILLIQTAIILVLVLLR